MALEPIKRSYDLIIVDTPPNAGELQYNAMQAADGLIIPLQSDIVSLQGLYLLHDTAQQIRASNPALTISGIVLTRYNARSTIARQMEQKIIDTAAELGIPYLGAVREAVAIREAQTLQRSLYQYAPTSKPALDYKTILQKIIGG
jgi:chromosome partitioning protein